MLTIFLSFIRVDDVTKSFNIAVYELNTSTPANYPKYGIYTFGISNDGNLELKTFLNFVQCQLKKSMNL